MSAVTLLEGTLLKKSEWLEFLEVTIVDINDMVNAKILRADEADRYRLTFVGIVVFEDSLLFARPKFDDSSLLSLHTVLRVLRTYFGRSPLRRPFVDRTRDPEYGNSELLREFDALLALRNWFFSHGVYRREEAQTGARGRPHWVKTMVKRSPLIIQGSVVYPHIIAERREGIFNHISGLQVSLLRHLLERYGFEVPEAVARAEQATGTPISHWPLPIDQRSYQLRRLAIEQRNVFRTDTLNLLNLLREALDSKLAGSSPRLQIYGTTAFYAVWEDACRVAFSGRTCLDLGSIVGQPVWWGYDEVGSQIHYKETQIPDIVVLQETWCCIIDAKYYYPFPESRPGGPDIIKQFYYAESLRVERESVLSIFLMPKPGAVKPTFLGYATIEGAHRAFGNIEAWGCDPASLLARYVSTSARGTDNFLATILAQRECVAEMINEAPTHVGG